VTQYQLNLWCPSISVYKLFEHLSYMQYINRKHHTGSLTYHCLVTFIPWNAHRPHYAQLRDHKGENGQKQLHDTSRWIYTNPSKGVSSVCHTKREKSTAFLLCHLHQQWPQHNTLHHIKMCFLSTKTTVIISIQPVLKILPFTSSFTQIKVGWNLVGLSKQRRSYCAFKVIIILRNYAE